MFVIVKEMNLLNGPNETSNHGNYYVYMLLW